MTLLRFDSVGGASGDMILAALIDAGARVADLRTALATLPLEPFTLTSRRVTRNGHAATQVRVTVPHTDDHHHHHPHHHAAPSDHHAHHRTLRTIRGLIRRAKLPTRVKTLSLAVFQRLAEAEGRVHRMPPDEVHFHEVGAVDSIVDIVGACLALDQLGIAAVAVGPLPEGRGTVTCAHGVMPIPVPATAELLKDHPVVLTDEPFEMVTPTGAALLMTWRDLLPAPAGENAGAIRRIGTGVGSRTLQGRPNLLRALVIEPLPVASPATASGEPLRKDHQKALQDECLVLECNLDDANPEWIGALLPRLIADGALDAFATPVQMKKQRPGIQLTVLCPPARREAMLDLLFRESTTFGVREHLVRRTLLERRRVLQKTPYGPIHLKEGRWHGRLVTRAPEYDDCQRAADRHRIPLRQIYAAALHPDKSP